MVVEVVWVEEVVEVGDEMGDEMGDEVEDEVRDEVTVRIQYSVWSLLIPQRLVTGIRT